MIKSPQVARTDEAQRDCPDEPTEEDAAIVCPLCGVSADSTETVYTHLQVGHKKSELAELVVER